MFIDKYHFIMTFYKCYINLKLHGQLIKGQSKVFYLASDFVHEALQVTAVLTDVQVLGHPRQPEDL